MSDRKIDLTIDIQNETFRRNREFGKVHVMLNDAREIPEIIAQLEVVNAIDAVIAEKRAEMAALPTETGPHTPTTYSGRAWPA